VWTFLSSWRTDKGIRASEAGAPERERVTARERERERIKRKTTFLSWSSLNSDLHWASFLLTVSLWERERERQWRRAEMRRCKGEDEASLVWRRRRRVQNGRGKRRDNSDNNSDNRWWRALLSEMETKQLMKKKKKKKL
jgi:hypothetical protein